MSQLTEYLQENMVMTIITGITFAIFLTILIIFLIKYFSTASLVDAETEKINTECPTSLSCTSQCLISPACTKLKTTSIATADATCNSRTAIAQKEISGETIVNSELDNRTVSDYTLYANECKAVATTKSNVGILDKYNTELDKRKSDYLKTKTGETLNSTGKITENLRKHLEELNKKINAYMALNLSKQCSEGKYLTRAYGNDDLPSYESISDSINKDVVNKIIPPYGTYNYYWNLPHSNIYTQASSPPLALQPVVTKASEAFTKCRSSPNCFAIRYTNFGNKPSYQLITAENGNVGSSKWKYWGDTGDTLFNGNYMIHNTDVDVGVMRVANTDGTSVNKPMGLITKI